MYQLLPQVKVARNVFIDLLTSEKVYIHRLNRTIQEFLLPLRSKAADSVAELQDVIAIFCNIETIVEVHEKLYKGLLEIQEECWPVVQGLGHLFLKYASNFQNYGEFAENYKTSELTLTKVLSQKKNRLRDTIEVIFF